MLTVIAFAGIETTPSQRHSTWECLCTCGGRRICRANQLGSGKLNSCGCSRKKYKCKATIKGSGTISRGLARTPLGKVYSSIVQRTSNPNSQQYANYGGRGIMNLFEGLHQFVDWAEANGYEKGLSIDRIDNDGHYEPANCRWVTQRIQNRNKRTSRLTAENVAVIKSLRGKKIYRKIGDDYGVSYSTIASIMNGDNWADIPPA